MMTKTTTGACACGAIRYETEAEPVAQLHCQCGQCQKLSGTGHASFTVFAAPVRFTGTPKFYETTADSGNRKHQHFCADCGTTTHVTFPAQPGVTGILTGTLDDASGFAPSFVTYHGKAQTWDMVDKRLTLFDAMPTG